MIIASQLSSASLISAAHEGDEGDADFASMATHPSPDNTRYTKRPIGHACLLLGSAELISPLPSVGVHGQHDIIDAPSGGYNWLLSVPCSPYQYFSLGICTMLMNRGSPVVFEKYEELAFKFEPALESKSKLALVLIGPRLTTSVPAMVSESGLHLQHHRSIISLTSLKHDHCN